MKNLRNSVQLIGNVGTDPELRTFDGGKVKASFAIATHNTYHNSKGEKIDETQWHNLVLWGKLAEIAKELVIKGSEIAIEGRLIHRSYETASKEKRYVTEVNVNELMVLGKRK
jgi:single-strand DNA-binding protein